MALEHVVEHVAGREVGKLGRLIFGFAWHMSSPAQSSNVPTTQSVPPEPDFSCYIPDRTTSLDLVLRLTARSVRLSILAFKNPSRQVEVHIQQHFHTWLLADDGPRLRSMDLRTVAYITSCRLLSVSCRLVGPRTENMLISTTGGG